MAIEAEAPAAECPICGATGARDIVYRLRAFDVIGCRSCGALERHPLPSDEEMTGYYRDPRYIEGGYFADERAAGARSPETEIFLEALGVLASRRRESALATPGRLLDVGAGSGAFLELATTRGWQAEGIELSPELAARAAARSGAPVTTGDFATLDLGPGRYDAITLWDVLEHTRDPGIVLDRARAMLAPAGVVVIFTIDAASLFNVVADFAWRATRGSLSSPLELLYDKRHNHYFTARTLATLLGRHGLRIERSQTHRAHLGRWLSEPASRAVLLGAEIVDAFSVPLGRPYRQLLYCVAS